MLHIGKTKYNFFLLLVAVFFTFSTTSCANPFSEIDLPIIQEAFDVQKGFSAELNTEYLNYKLKITFPAKEVLDFYKKHFDDLHLKRFDEDGYGNGQWVNFNPTTGKWDKTNSPPARYIATWVDKEKKMRVILGLKYKYDAADAEKGKNTLIVDCKVTNFFDFRENKSPLNE